MSLGTTKQPSNKVELIRSIQKLYNPKIVCFDVTDDKVKSDVTKRLNDLSKKGGLSVILISDP